MKNMLSEMKSILDGINRVDEEDQTTDMEDGEDKNTQSKQQEKGSQDYNNNLRSLWSTIKCKNIHVMGVPDGKQGVE